MKVFWENKTLFFGLSIIVSLILYGNTLTHKYALDDAIVITKNEFTKQGFSGIDDIFTNESFTGFFGRKKELVSGGRYRPLSIATFAVEYELFGQNPFFSHFINILLYGCIGWFIYIVFSQLLAYRLNEKTTLQVGLLSALLFLIHPIHTECVANIKGRDELLSLLFSLWALLQILKFINEKKVIHLIVAPALLFIGMLSKENAITFVAIIPLALWFFTKSKLKKIITITGALTIGAALFIAIRTHVLGGINFETATELMNNPFVHVSSTQKLATVLFTWLLYLKLLAFPHPLTFDYYPKHIPIMDFSSPWVILSLVLIIGIFALAFKGIRKKTILSFTILAFAITFSLVSNLLFSVGTFMNERFVFMSSVFWVLPLSYFLIQLYQNKKLRLLALITLGYMLVFYPIKTVARNTAWKNDFTLFTTDVKVSKNSAKSNCSAGGQLWEAGKKLDAGTRQTNYYTKAEFYLRKAVKIHKTYVDAWLLLGNVLFDMHKDIEGSANCYMNVIKLQPQNTHGWTNIDIVLQNSDDRKLQYSFYQQLYKIDSAQYIPNYRLGVLYGRYFNQINQSILFLEKAVQINPNKKEALKDLGTAYGISKQPEKAYKTLTQIIKKDSTDAQVYINLGIACQQLGKANEAGEYFNRAKSINQ